MPRKKKSPREMTDDEIAKKVFPKKVIEKVKEIANEPDNKATKESSQG